MPSVPNALRGLRGVLGGGSAAEKLADIGKTEAMSAEERHSLRERRLSALLDECFEYVEAYRPYRSLRGKAKSRPFDVLNELPVLTDDVYRKSPDMYFNPAKLSQVAGGVSRTAAGHNYPVCKDARSADTAARTWAYSQLGLTYMSKHLSIRGALPAKGAVSEAARAFKLAVSLNERGLFGSYINADMLKKYAERLSNPGLNYCAGTPSVINALAELFERNGIPVAPSYKGIVTVGETLLQTERETVRRVLGAPVYGSYSTPDDGLIACECEHQTLHVIESCFIVEEIDGRIAVTSLNNSAAPRMRYVTRETGMVMDSDCDCGRGGKRLLLSERGKTPLYTAPDGRVIPGGVFDIEAGRYYNIARYKLTQPDPEHAELYVELRTAAAVDEAAGLHRLVRELMPGTLVDLRSAVAR